MDNIDNFEVEIDVETLSNEEINQGPSEKKARNSYTVEKKLEVIQFAKKHGIQPAHRRYSVCRGSIHLWIKQEEKLQYIYGLNNECEMFKFRTMNRKSTKSRLPGAGRHLLNSNMDEQIYLWFNDLRKKKLRVTRQMIQNKAKEFYNQINILEEEKENFVASNGWLEKWLKRHNLSCRMQTTVCQKPPEFYEKEIVSFLDSVFSNFYP